MEESGNGKQVEDGVVAEFLAKLDLTRATPLQQVAYICAKLESAAAPTAKPPPIAGLPPAGEAKALPAYVPTNVHQEEKPDSRFARGGGGPVYWTYYRDRGLFDTAWHVNQHFDRYDCLNQYETKPAPPIGNRRPLTQEYFNLVLAMADTHADVRPIYKQFHELYSSAHPAE